MAHRAYLRMDFLGGAARIKAIAATAANADVLVFWMYTFFHNETP